MNVIVPGTVAAEPGTMTRAILDVFEALLAPAIFAASETGLARFSNAIAVGVCGNIVASIDDTKYLQVDGGEIVGGDGGGGGGAPADAQYLVASSNGDLTAERVATDTATVTWDFGVAGQAKANVPDASTTTKGVVELATDGETNSGVAVQGNDGRLSNARTPTAHASSHENLGGDEINVTGLSGELADPQPPKTHASSHSDGASDPVDVTDLAGFSGVSTEYLSGQGTWTTPTTVETAAAYAAASISNNVGISAGVAFNAFITPDIPEGFSGYISFEFGIAAGDAASPLAGYTHAGRALLRRATAGSLSVTDVGSTSLGEGTTYTASLNASGNAFRTQITMGTTTTAYVRGWYRIYGRVLP